MFRVYKIVYFLFFLILFFCLSCSHDKENNDFSEARNYLIRIEELYQDNIDSAFRFAKFHESTIINFDDAIETINLYSFFTEIYQYNIPDDVKALEYTAKIVDIINSEGIARLKNPYVYINIGNVLLKNSQIEQAAEMYSNALESAIELNNSGVIALISENVATLYRKTGNCRMATFFYDLASTKIEDKYGFQYAHNVLNRIDNQIVCKDTAGLAFLFKEVDSILSKKKILLEDGDEKSRNIFTYYDLSANYHKLFGRYCVLVSNSDFALNHLMKAKAFADLMKNNLTSAELNFETARFYSLIEQNDSAFLYAQLAYSYFEKSNMLDEAFKTSKFLMKLAPDGFKSKIYAENRAITKRYNEEVERQKKASDKIKIAQSNAVISINNLKKSQRESLTKIKYRNYAIVSISLFTILLFLSFLMILSYNRRLLSTKIELARRSVQLIKARQAIESKSVDESQKNDLKEELEKLMKTEKLFLMSKIKLSDVADALGSNQTYISQVVNSNYGLNFNDYINSLRVQYFCQLIDNLEEKDIVIDAMYPQIGFTSKSTFYSAFKKFMGLSPVQYVKLNNQKSFPES